MTRYKAANIKRSTQDELGLYIRHAIHTGQLHRHTHKCSLLIDWFEPNSRRDCDNVAFAIKFIQDALVENGIFPDDSRKYIEGIAHRVHTDGKEPRIEVTILEGEDRKCLE